MGAGRWRALSLISLQPTDTLALAETLAWAALSLQRGGRDADRGSESPPAISPKSTPKRGGDQLSSPSSLPDLGEGKRSLLR